MRNFISRFGLALVALGFTGLTAQAQWTLSGTVTYTGRQTGEVWVAPSLNGLTPNLARKVSLGTLSNQPFTNAAFALPNLDDQGYYYIFAWRDSSANGISDITEAQAWHPSGSFLMTSNRTVAGFVITDPDKDNDGLPDWWEAKYGLTNRMGSGRSGSLIVYPGQTNFTDSVWASVLGSNPAGTTTLNVSTTNGFATNDLVLIITMQDTNLNLTLNSAGTYEFGRIASLTQGGGVTNLVLTAPHTNAFTPGTTQKIQVLKVPEYTDLNLAGTALSFDGIDDYVSLGGATLSGPWTAEFWVNRQDSPDASAVLLNGGGTGLKLEQSGTARLVGFTRYTVADYAFNYTAPTNIWVHLAFVSDTTTTRLYVNGVAQDTNSHTISLTLGQLGAIGDRLKGSIGEVRIWSVARSQAQIQANMNRSLLGTQSDLVAYYPMDEGTGTKVYDATPNHLDGVLVNGPTWQSGGTLTCQAWNGTHGGVLAFQAYQVTLGSNSVISADGKGYRGGPDYALADTDGYQGESFTGFWPVHSITDNFGGGGGGGRSWFDAGNSGGGGGYGLPGAVGMITPLNAYYPDRTTALVPAFGGNSYGTSTVARVFMGSGGGSGGQDGNDTGDGNYNGGVGGAGGGILVCSVGYIINNGQISSSGQTGSSQTAGERGTGGGGAGGSVWITANWQSAGGVVQARCGLGGQNAPCVGGAGGVGRLRLDMPAGAVVPTLDPAAGYVQLIPVTNAISGLAVPLWSPCDDTDQDGLSDLREYELDTNPLSADTDGDGLPDGWEVAYGLNPTNGLGATAVVPGDLLTYSQKYRYGLNPLTNDTDGEGLTDYQELFVYHTDPLRPDTDGDGISDGAEVAAGTDPLVPGTQYFYDAIDRLVGVQYDNGLALTYDYDRNNNLVRQVYMQRSGNTDVLPPAWRFLNGLTNNTSAFVDSDGDGWSDYQEWLAGTDPRDPNSHPDLLGGAGTNLASLALSFTPSNFVVGVGQLDGLGAEEIVISADGNPGATTNFLLILSQSVSNWSTEPVFVGSNGVTSIAVGQPANCACPAIYVGLRQPGGHGSVVQFFKSGGQWVSNTIATSTNEAAFVLGVRPGRDVLASFAPTNAPPGSPSCLTFDGNAWTFTRAGTSTSQRGLGTVTPRGLQGLASRGVRLLDAGGLQIMTEEGLLPTNTIWNSSYSRWFFPTPSAMAWDASQSYAQTLGGNLATVNDVNLNSWLYNQYKGLGNYWIGLRRASWTTPASGAWIWASGTPFAYSNWHSGEPSGSSELAAMVWSSDATWNDGSPATTMRGIVEVEPTSAPTVSVNEPPASQRLLWRGNSLNAGNLRLTNAVSILYTFVNDKNMSGVMDAGDEFVVAEYLYSGGALSINALQRIPLSGACVASCYGLASVDVLYGNQQVFFTAEPDGRMFSWSATNAAAPLQRQLFSAQHAGKAWHALTGVKTLEAGECLVGLRTDPTPSNRCDVILWPPQRQLWTPTVVPQTAPITQILPSPSQGRDIARVDILIWDAEGGTALPELEYQTNGLTWSSASIVALSGAAYGFVASSPAGLTYTASWDAARDLGPGFTNTVKLHARARDITLTGDWSPPVLYAVQNSLANNPRAYDDAASTMQGMPVNIDVLANDTVLNAAPKLIASLGPPAHGSAVTNLNKTVRYTPLPDFTGTDQFVYTLTDGAGAIDMATVTVTVNAGAPIVLASPALQGGNRFSMTIWGASGDVYQVQTSTNLAYWTNVARVTNQSGGAVPFTEQVPTNARARFYRAVLTAP